jgi:hypothetical protein
MSHLPLEFRVKYDGNQVKYILYPCKTMKIKKKK